MDMLQENNSRVFFSFNPGLGLLFFFLFFIFPFLLFFGLAYSHHMLGVQYIWICREKYGNKTVYIDIYRQASIRFFPKFFSSDLDFRRCIPYCVYLDPCSTSSSHPFPLRSLCRFSLSLSLSPTFTCSFQDPFIPKQDWLSDSVSSVHYCNKQ